MILGKYLPLNTLMHRLDPRIKIIGLIIAFVAVFLQYGSTQQNFLMYGIFFVAFLAMMLIGKVSFLSVFRSLKAIWLMMIFLLLINVLVASTGSIAFYIGSFAVYWDGIIKTAYIIIRLLLMIMITTILTATTKPLELTFGLEWLMAPLSLIKVPVHMIAMTLSLSLRFIPTLMEETDKIMRAQASRGVDFKEGKLKEKFSAVISLVIPLFVSCLIKAGDLADAMESRGYDPKAQRTRYRERKWNFIDTVDIVFISFFLAGIICLAVFQPDFIALFEGVF
jgi:energy-coupling factor transport system permease protein